MALSEFEIARCERVVGEYLERRRPPAHIRDKLDLGYRIDGQSVTIFEIRPVWNDPSRKMEIDVAKVTYVKARSIWKIYWKRADMKWRGYEPESVVGRVEDFVAVVERDEFGCFWG